MNPVLRYQYYYSNNGESPGDDFTNGLDEQITAFWGDSFAQGSNNSTGAGPTPEAGIAYYWNHTNNTKTEITNADVLGAANGSMIPQYCISKYTATGKKTIAVLGGFSGSKFYDAGGSNSFDTGGTLYATAKARTDAALAANSISKPKAIVVTSMGVNDISGAAVIADVVTAIDSFFTRITTDYPDTIIIVSVPGRTSSAENMNNRFALVREAIYRNARTRANVRIGPYFPQYVGRSLYGADNLHLTQTGNNQAATDFVNSELSTYHKHTQAVLNMMTAAISDTKKNAINTWITNQQSNLALLDTLQIWTSEAQQDALTDWVFRTCTKINNGATWATKSGLQTDGAATYIRPEFIPSLQGVYGTANDFFCSVWIIDNQTPVATQGNAIGGINSTQRIQLFQNTSSQVAYQAHDGGGQTIGDTSLLDNTLYTIARTNSTTKRILKNGVQVISVTQSATAALARELYVGATNSTGTAASFLNCNFRVFAFGREAGFDHASFYTSLNTLLTALSV